MTRFSPTSGTTSASVPIAATLMKPGSQLLAAGPSAERLHQLQRDADPGQMLVGIAAIAALGVDHGERRRQLVSGSWWSVMMRSTPSSRARRAASAPRIPQSTETTSATPSACSRSIAAGWRP